MLPKLKEGQNVFVEITNPTQVGPDVKENIIILCPSHHTEFDYGSIGIDMDTKKITHINPQDSSNGKDLYYSNEDLGSEFIKFHYEQVFNKK